MAIEDRSPAWRWGQSWYLLLILTFGTFSWLMFFYMAARARRFGWAVWGFFYLAAFIRILSSPQVPGPDGQPTLGEGAAVGLLLLWIISTIHALVARKAFLRALDARQGGTPAYAGADPYAAVRAADTTPAPAHAQDDFAVFNRPNPAQSFTAPPPPPPAAPPPYTQPAAAPPPMPQAAPPPPPSAGPPPPPPFSGPAPFGGARPFEDDDRREPPAPPPPPRKPGRQVDY